MKKTIALISIVLTNVIFTFATPQRGDRIHWNGSVHRLIPYPLDLWTEFELTSKLLFGIEEMGFTSDCGRGFQAEWVIIENNLYLKEIYSCSYFNSRPYDDSLKADLLHIFPDRFENGTVKADWVSGSFWLSKGEIIYYDHSLGAIYEKDILLSFQGGVLTNINEYNNIEKSYKSKFSDQEILNEFIYSKVDWDKLPELNSKSTVVYVSFEVHEPGAPRNFKIVRGASSEFNDEALRVISLLPEWSIYYTFGKYYQYVWNLPVIFSEENRKKYAR